MNADQIKMLRSIIKQEIEAAGIDGMEHGVQGWAERQLDESWAEFKESFTNEAREDVPWLDCADGFKDLPDEDADLIDSGSRIGQFESVSLSATNNPQLRGRRRIWIGI